MQAQGWFSMLISRKGELHLVAIEIDFFSRKSRQSRGPDKPSYVLQCFFDLLSLILHLLGIIQILPFTSPADAEMRTSGNRPEEGRPGQFDRLGFDEIRP